MSNEHTVIQEILGGNQALFKGLVDRYKRLVAHIVFRMIPVESDREDICQEVFIKVYQNLARFRGEAKFSTWIGRVTHNKCIDYLKLKKLPIEDVEDVEGSNRLIDKKIIADDNMEKKELAFLVQAEIDLLPIRYGTILTLYHLHDMSYFEIGDIMKLPEGTVKSYLYRGRKQLKEKLATKYNMKELW